MHAGVIRCKLFLFAQSHIMQGMETLKFMVSIKNMFIQQQHLSILRIALTLQA